MPYIINTHGTILPQDVSFTFINENDVIDLFVCIDDLNNKYAEYDNLRFNHDFIYNVLEPSMFSFIEAMENTFTLIANDEEVTSMNDKAVDTLNSYLIAAGWKRDDSIYGYGGE